MVKKRTANEYDEQEGTQMYQRIINKYKATKEAILICLRDKEHQLVKSELLNYDEKLNKKKP